MFATANSITRFLRLRSRDVAARTVDSIDRRLSGHMLWTKFRFHGQRGRFYRDLARSAQNIDGTSLTTVVEKYARRYPKLPVGVMARHWLRRWEHSGQFSQVIRGTVPDEDIVVIQASESLGDLNSGILMLGENIMQLQKTKEALIYSLGTSGLLFGFFHVFMALQAFLVQARLEKAVVRYLKPDEIPALAHVFFTTASVIRTYWPLWLVFLAGLVALIIWSLPRYTGRMRPWLDRNVIFYTMYRDFRGAAFLKALGSVTRLYGGRVVQLNDALLRMRMFAYPWLRWHIDQILKNLENNPNGQGEVFNTGFTSAEVAYQIQDMAEHTAIGPMLEQIGDLVMETAPEDCERRANRLRYTSIFLLLLAMVCIYLGTGLIINDFQTIIKARSAIAGF
ncbi:hypothetical protein E2P84_42410 [Burkholderia cepacia]|uniref:Type II secretion system protein GspF domain-containing protein n=1 Tax=Burkholderia cepacia TaxID=292 RepID=A0AAX2RR39_BURCE|nr:hypothetical protein [Burkholderia cepacia]TES62211.1 hypothetical protein E2P84_42410 [Burkholderia cepacia]TET01709.1 hypothetical protein E3D36_16880 [Burkholderia cepacia]TEU47567.1 hypothetical protein E3D37_16310 [Burkholderia cepacia]TEU53439.1 hypothetical protein E3D38_11895 [Burkholderia cepacia]TEV02200.1 hypothetical protein E3D40_13630 [Burkholderia cepacia]